MRLIDIDTNREFVPCDLMMDGTLLVHTEFPKENIKKVLVSVKGGGMWEFVPRIYAKGETEIGGDTE